MSNRFGDDVVARALVSNITGEGGALIPQDFMADLIELLRASTAVRGANPMEVGMPMGNLTIPRLAGRSDRRLSERNSTTSRSARSGSTT